MTHFPSISYKKGWNIMHVIMGDPALQNNSQVISCINELIFFFLIMGDLALQNISLQLFYSLATF